MTGTKDFRVTWGLYGASRKAVVIRLSAFGYFCPIWFARTVRLSPDRSKITRVS